MNTQTHYKFLTDLANLKREEHGVETSTLNLTVVRRIYRAEKIRIDLWGFPSRIRAAYMCEDSDPSVAINKSLPREPKLFSLIHELKHHYLDRNLIADGTIRCGDYNAQRDIEVAAEMFAAEFIFPEREFLDYLMRLGIESGTCSPEQVVYLKRECRACISYQFLQKRLLRLGFANEGAFKGVKFQKLEEQMFGTPIYKQDWFRRARSRRLQSR